MACMWYSICPLRRHEREGKIDLRWAEQYCQPNDGWKECRRYKLEEQGLSHPDNMLPDGSIEKTLM